MGKRLASFGRSLAGRIFTIRHSWRFLMVGLDAAGDYPSPNTIISLPSSRVRAWCQQYRQNHHLVQAQAGRSCNNDPNNRICTASRLILLLKKLAELNCPPERRDRGVQELFTDSLVREPRSIELLSGANPFPHCCRDVGGPDKVPQASSLFLCSPSRLTLIFRHGTDSATVAPLLPKHICDYLCCGLERSVLPTARCVGLSSPMMTHFALE